MELKWMMIGFAGIVAAIACAEAISRYAEYDASARKAEALYGLQTECAKAGLICDGVTMAPVKIEKQQ